MPRPVTRPMRALISWIAHISGQLNSSVQRGRSRTGRRPANWKVAGRSDAANRRKAASRHARCSGAGKGLARSSAADRDAPIVAGIRTPKPLPKQPGPASMPAPAQNLAPKPGVNPPSIAPAAAPTAPPPPVVHAPPSPPPVVHAPPPPPPCHSCTTAAGPSLSCAAAVTAVIHAPPPPPPPVIHAPPPPPVVHAPPPPPPPVIHAPPPAAAGAPACGRPGLPPCPK